MSNHIQDIASYACVADIDNLTDRLEAQQQTHDRLLAAVGTARIGAVHFWWFPRDQALAEFDELCPVIETPSPLDTVNRDRIHEFLTENPGGAMVMATVKIDLRRAYAQYS